MTRPTLVLPDVTALEAVPVAEIPALIGECERIKALLWTRLTAAAPAPRTTHTPSARPPTDMIGYRDGARILGVSPATLRRLVAAGQIPHVRIGRRVLLRRETLERFAADREQLAGYRS